MAHNKIPSHVDFIPDGNRRWAVGHGLSKEAGYSYGIDPGYQLYEKCKEYGIQEVSIYCFTQDNTKRPSIQKQAFIEATVAFAFEIVRRGAALLVVGDETSMQFPIALKEFRQRQGVGMKVNLLVNYGWEWDLAGYEDQRRLCRARPRWNESQHHQYRQYSTKALYALCPTKSS